MADPDGAEDAAHSLGLVERPCLHRQQVLAARPAERGEALARYVPRAEAGLEPRGDGSEGLLGGALAPRQGQDPAEIPRVTYGLTLEVSAPRSGGGRGLTPGSGRSTCGPDRGANVAKEAHLSSEVNSMSASA
jgi:hypothetical protein